MAGLVAASSSIALAQGMTQVRRIGVLHSAAPESPEDIREQAEPLRKLGWVEGQNLQVERRYASGRSEELGPMAEELVRAKVEIIVTAGTAATLAAKRATSTIPIVFSAGDPVLVGLVASLARPGGNLTGISQAGPEVTAKYLSLLKELLPRLQRIGVLWDARNPYARAARDQFEHVCQSLDLVPIIVEIPTAGEIGGAIAQLAQQRAQALVLPTCDIVWRNDSKSSMQR